MSQIKKNTEDTWLAIVNPNAGRRKCEKDWPQIEQLLKDYDIDYVASYTQKRYHAVKLTKEAISKGFRRFLVVGGDGTLNEVVNGIFLQDSVPTTEMTLGMISVGTGNDWGRMFKIPTNYQAAVETLLEARTYTQDVGKVTFHQGDLKKSRYFMNVSGLGYDALVAQETNIQKDQGKGGPLSYFINIFKGLFKYKIANAEINIDGEPVKTSLFSMNVGICKYNGGGLMQLPHAIPNDGLLDITVIGKIGKFFIIRHANKLHDGSFVKLPQIKTFKGKHIQIKSFPEKSIYLETDGESMGHTPMDFTIIPASIKVIIKEEPE